MSNKVDAGTARPVYIACWDNNLNQPPAEDVEYTNGQLVMIEAGPAKPVYIVNIQEQ
jgi:hypothetical protein